MSMGNIGGPCQDRSGFLFDHACSRIATGMCQSCNRAICAEHTTRSGDLTGDLMVCATCKKQGLRQTQAQPDARVAEPMRSEERPYYYGYGRYHGWGYYGTGYWGHSHYPDRHHDSTRHDRHDFTEADAASLSAEDEAWETDMGAS
jgi:hypothetical protein